MHQSGTTSWAGESQSCTLDLVDKTRHFGRSRILANVWLAARASHALHDVPTIRRKEEK